MMTSKTYEDKKAAWPKECYSDALARFGVAKMARLAKELQSLDNNSTTDDVEKLVSKHKLSIADLVVLSALLLNFYQSVTGEDLEKIN